MKKILYLFLLIAGHFCILIGSLSSNIYRFLPTHRSSAALLPLCGIPVSMIEPFVGGRELRRLTDKCAQETHKHRLFRGIFLGCWDRYREIRAGHGWRYQVSGRRANGLLSNRGHPQILVIRQIYCRGHALPSCV